MPPAVRNLARAVIARNRSVSSARPSAVALNEITAVCGRGCGRMPGLVPAVERHRREHPGLGVLQRLLARGAGRVAR